MASAITLFSGITNNPGRTSDDLLMLRYARGERGAFDVLYARYKQPLYGFFYRNCHSSVVDELFQDVWLRVIASARRYESKNKFRSWLFTMAHNCLVDFHRSSKRRLARAALDEMYYPGKTNPYSLSLDYLVI